MSNLIQKIKNDIKAIEDSVTSDMDKVVIYDQLIVSYNLHKDLIALYEDSEMELDTSTSEEEIEAMRERLRASDDDVFTARAEIITLEEEKAALEEQVRVLEAWKDGANLEGEQLKEQLIAAEESIIKYAQLVLDITYNTEAAINTLNNSITMSLKTL